MSQQTRWYCEDCRREWVWAYHWEPSMGCPICRSQQVTQVTFSAVFPGADIHTKAADVPVGADLTESTPVPAMPPALVLMPRNDTLLRVEPEAPAADLFAWMMGG